MEKWLEIDLDKLKQNVRALQSYIKVPIMAVIKQNAYGMGAQVMGNYLEQLGINYFAVTNINEGVELRQGGLVSPILVFAPELHAEGSMENLWQYNLIPAIYSLEEAEILNNYALAKDRPIEAHVKADTGMGRLGFTPGELLAAAARLKELGGIRYGGIFTHYSNAFEKQFNYTKKQMDRLLGLSKELETMGLTFPLKYSANSLAALKFPETHMDMVSIGSAFLGNNRVNPAVALTRMYRCRARVLQVRSVARGEYIGYSNTFKTARDTRIAVLPIGYSDGFGLQKRIDSFRLIDFLREFKNLVSTFLKPVSGISFAGRPLKILGKTSIQLTVVEVGDLPVKPGDIVDIEINPLWISARMERVYLTDTEKIWLQQAAAGRSN